MAYHGPSYGLSRECQMKVRKVKNIAAIKCTIATSHHICLLLINSTASCVCINDTV